MLDLDAIAVFVKVVQAGSFRRAGEQLAMPNSTVSACVSRLEKRLGVTLLQRTTRSSRLTEAGESYFRLAAQAVEQITNAEAQISAAQTEPQGILRITAPVDIATDWFSAMTADFRSRYPKIDLEFVFTDQLLDIRAERIDVALRAGSLPDSRLVARRVGLSCWMLFASPAYLRKVRPPSQPRQLASHSLIQFTKAGREHWRLRRGLKVSTISLPHNILANDATLVRRLALAGNGIALLPFYLCREELLAGRLVRVLPEWAGKSDPIHLVYARERFISAKVRAFIDFAARSLQRVFNPD